MNMNLIWNGYEFWLTTGKHRVSYFVITVYVIDINLICNGYELDMCWTQFPWKRWIIKSGLGVKTGNTQSSLFWYNSICYGYEFDMKWIWIIYIYLIKYPWKSWMIKSGFWGKTEYSQRNSSWYNIMICNAYEFYLKWIWILSEMDMNFISNACEFWMYLLWYQWNRWMIRSGLGLTT